MRSARARQTEDKRAAILDAALRLFGRYGYRRASIGDIAREAGIAKGTVYLYFETKEALFRALSQKLLDRVLDDARRAAAIQAPVTRRLQAILEAKFVTFHEILRGSPHAGELMDSKNRLCGDLFDTAEATYRRLVTRTIAEAGRGGELALGRLGLAPGRLADLLLAGAHGLEADGGGAGTRAPFGKRLGRLVTVMLAGISGDVSRARSSRPD